MRIVNWIFFAAAVVACGSTNSSPGSGATPTTTADASAGLDGGDEASLQAGADTVVTPFDHTPIYFAGSDNRRTVDTPATFPDTGAYAKIVLHLSLDCPTGGCDPWDRFGTLGVVTKKATTDGGADTVVEIARFMTPYHVASKWDLDVTDLRPLLSGAVTMRAFIDTWVGPGSKFGGGWALTASFEMTGGTPDRLPVAVTPIWTMTNAVYGDPARPVGSTIAPQSLTLPSGASQYAVRAFVTGHGQGNADNCAEFCPRDHTITAGATAHTTHLWRADCAKTATPGQQGTWMYPRAGWCPGADVKPWTFDVTPDVAGGATFAYAAQPYENTCRPDAVPDGGTCQGCALGGGCAYDGGNHTEPYYAVSALLIAYR